MMKIAAIALAALSAGAACLASPPPATAPSPDFHLTARPWKPLNIPRDAYLDTIEGICRFTARHLGPNGEVIDPLLHREHQYSTPYFAFAVGTLVHAGRAKDLLEHGVKAMDHATACFAGGLEQIPDQHGEFFIPCLAGALEVYDGLVPPETMERWRQRLRIPIERVIRNNRNNWRAYAMRGEWLRAKLDLVDRASAVGFIENSWLNDTQRQRLADDRWHLYQDRGTDPDSHAVEAVGRANILALVALGYDGPSADEMRRLAEDGTRISLLLQDPSGQCPPDGRADDHVFNDVLYQLCFDIMSQRARRAGDVELAGRYRRAAALAFNSIQRWRRDDEAWAGSFFITKNRFDPTERVGYQRASNIGNYNGAVMLHLSEAFLSRGEDIAERPAPSEIGGYAFATDKRFASAVACAGGMQVLAALRGDTKLVYDHYWTSLGVNRFARAGWETRLGPSDGTRDARTGRGVTFAPTWLENGRWIRLADVPDRYAGTFSVQFVHPLLVRCAIEYAPVKAGDAPRFRHEFTITPDGVLATLHCDGPSGGGGVPPAAVTWPIMENDGAPLKVSIAGGIATCAYDERQDQQCFISVDPTDPQIDSTDGSVQGTYGWLRPVRVVSAGAMNRTFVYPRSDGDPSAEDVRGSFRLADDGFESVLGSVHGSLYIGRTSAGGEGQAIDIDGDGNVDAAFGIPCRFILQLRQRRIVAVEADRPVRVVLDGDKTLDLQPCTPVQLAE